jgi:hypothetical protein
MKKILTLVAVAALSFAASAFAAEDKTEANTAAVATTTEATTAATNEAGKKVEATTEKKGHHHHKWQHKCKHERHHKGAGAEKTGETEGVAKTEATEPVVTK